MRIAVAGKGGSGKTTISGVLARLYARQGKRVLAIDGDSNPNLAVTLGIDAQAASSVPPLPPGLLRSETDPDGTRRLVFTKSMPEIVGDHGVDAPDGVRLLVASRIDHAGTG